MSAREKRVVVPEGMMKAAQESRTKHFSGPYGFSDTYCTIILEAALWWLSENPIAPTPEWAMEIAKSKFDDRVTGIGVATGAMEWQRRMFLAPEPEIPEEIKDLLYEIDRKGLPDPYVNDFTTEVDRRIIEAYRRGLRHSRYSKAVFVSNSQTTDSKTR